MTTCSADGCEVEVIWLENDHTGNRAPIEVRNTPDGNVTIDRLHGTWHVIVEADGEVPSSKRHLNHFATCEHADDYRRRCKACHKSPCIHGPNCPPERKRGRPRKERPAPESVQPGLF